MKIKDEYPDLLTLDGFDEAIIGVVERVGIQAICYDTDRIIEILKRDMDEDLAWLWFDMNIAKAWVGESTPLFLNRMGL
jgi:hypothetical protein